MIRGIGRTQSLYNSGELQHMTTYYLYVKTHNKTGLKYLGKTKLKDPHKYTGSGVYWLRHLKIHGKDYSTEILCECTSKEDLRKQGIYYSNLWNIVEDESWANLCPETGDGGSLPGHRNGMFGRTHSETTKSKLSIKAKNQFKGKSYEDLYGIEKAKDLKLQRTRSTRKARKNRPGNGSNNPNAKTMLFKDPNGIEYTIIGGLKKFCKDHFLCPCQIIALEKGRRDHYKGWSVRYLK